MNVKFFYGKSAKIEVMKDTIRILHINDLHSHFEQYPQLKRAVDDLSQTDRELIKVDLGDNVDKSHPLSDATAGRFNVALMNELGIDYATIGNNEGIGLAKAELDCLYEQANFQPIIGNLKDKGRQPDWAKPYLIYQTKAGTKIAFLAYTFPYYVTYAPNGWEVLNPLKQLEEDLARPEVQDSDLVVLLSHLGIRYDEQIAETYPQVNLIIGSHTHHLFEEGKLINETYLAAADRYGYYIGCIDLTVEDGQLRECQIVAIPTKTYLLDLDKEDQVFIQAMREEGYRRLAQEKVADLGRKLSFEETCQLVLEAVCRETDSQLTVLNTGLIMKTLGPQVTMADLQEALPHQMRMARLVVTGQELKEICQEVFTKAELLRNQTIKGMGFRGKTFGQVITGNFAYKNGNLLYNGRVVDSHEKFSLVLVDQYYYAAYFPTIKEKDATLLFPDLLRELVAKYLRKNGANWDKSIITASR